MSQDEQLARRRAEARQAGFEAGRKDQQTCRQNWRRSEEWVAWFEGWKQGQRSRGSGGARTVTGTRPIAGRGLLAPASGILAE